MAGSHAWLTMNHGKQRFGKMSTAIGGIELMNKMMVDLRNVLIPKTTVITHFCSARPHRRLLVKKEEE